MDIPQGRYEDVYALLDTDPRATEEMKAYVERNTYAGGWGDVNYFMRMVAYFIKDGKFAYVFRSSSTGYGSSPWDGEELRIGVVGEDGLEAEVEHALKQTQLQSLKINGVEEDDRGYKIAIERELIHAPPTDGPYYAPDVCDSWYIPNYLPKSKLSRRPELKR